MTFRAFFTRTWPAALAVLFALAFFVWRTQTDRERTRAETNAVEQTNEFKDAPAFAFVDQRAIPVTREDLLGQVWIANFFFTTCTSICPGMTAKLVLLQNRLAASELRFVSFSVDPENDTPEVLARYASEWNPAETRWTLLATHEAGLYPVARGFDVWVMPTGDIEDPIMHSGRFFLVDRSGHIRGSYNSEDEEAVERLIVDAAELAGNISGARASDPATLDGAQLFSALGCAGCHLDRRLAPALEGVFSSTVELEDGTRVVADEAYLRESILDPSARIVAGYRPTMPMYRGVLDEARLERLLSHVKSLAPNTQRPTERPKEALDPVCEMEITVFDDSPSVEYKGVRYYFCCELCRASFEESPDEYVKP